jgi:hypothetical protein
MGFRNPTNIPPGSITDVMLADGSVTGPKLSFDAIDGKTITGALIRTAAPPALRWEMTSLVANQLLAYSGLGTETAPGGVVVGAGGAAGQLLIKHPTTGLPALQGSVEVNQIDAGGSSEVRLKSSAGGVLEDVVTPANNLYWLNGQLFKDLTWTNLATVNSWTRDTVNDTAQYARDAAGNLWFRGAIKNGTLATIATLPAGYRPSQQWESPALRATAGAGAYSTVSISTAGVMAVATNLVNAQTRLAFNFCLSALA